MTAVGRRMARVCCCLLAVLVGTAACRHVTTPMEQFGHNIGDDYWLPNYEEVVDYLRKLDRESDRLTLVEYGRTVEDRPMVMAVITSPKNQRNLDHYKDVSRRLALAEGLTDDQARALSKEGKAVVWIDGGLHANEQPGTQHLAELAYQMVTRDDPETQRILDDVILLAAFSNPDGMDVIVNWYMREPEPTKRAIWGIPRLEQANIGHRNNRDFFVITQPETEAISRVLYREWLPQIVYNHHHHGPMGAVIATPPFRDPFNYNIDPLAIMGIELVGAAMNGRFVAEGKPGATWRSGTNYQTWWNGGLRTTPYFHNQIGLLTEISGSPTPIQIPFNPKIQLPRSDYPDPNPPYTGDQKWHFRQTIDYLITADRAVLDVASKYRQEFLFNIYQMGRNSIDRGSHDYVTITPKRIAATDSAMRADGARPVVRGEEQLRGYEAKYYDVLHDRAHRDARGYVIPSDQPDFLTATKFVNSLIKSGVTVDRTTAPCDIAGKTYPAESYVVKAAQAFRPHIRDMFEPQDYPDDIPYPGGPPRPPYDLVGYTLAYQMGVQFDRVFDAFDGPFEKVDDLAQPPAGEVSGDGAGGFLLSHEVNDAFLAINRLLAGGESVFWMKAPVQAGGRQYGAGAIYVAPGDSTRARLEKLAAEVGLRVEGLADRPHGEAFRLKPVRIGVWDQYGGSEDSGYMKWILRQFEFSAEPVFPPTLDAGGLEAKYDVLVFPDGAMGTTEAVQTGMSQKETPEPEEVPPEWRDKMGAITETKTIPQLRRFLNQGGTIITIGSSVSLGRRIGLPMADFLVESGTGRPLPSTKFFVPGSILRARVNTADPLAYGLPESVDVFFNNSPVFRIPSASGLRNLVSFDSEAPLRSGWAWGQRYLKGGSTALEADVGAGKLLMYGFDVTNRAESHGTYKLLFNGIYYGSAETVRF